MPRRQRTGGCLPAATVFRACGRTRAVPPSCPPPPSPKGSAAQESAGQRVECAFTKYLSTAPPTICRSDDLANATAVVSPADSRSQASLPPTNPIATFVSSGLNRKSPIRRSASRRKRLGVGLRLEDIAVELQSDFVEQSHRHPIDGVEFPIGQRRIEMELAGLQHARWHCNQRGLRIERADICFHGYATGVSTDTPPVFHGYATGVPRIRHRRPNAPFARPSSGEPATHARTHGQSCPSPPLRTPPREPRPSCTNPSPKARRTRHPLPADRQSQRPRDPNRLSAWRCLSRQRHDPLWPRLRVSLRTALRTRRVSNRRSSRPACHQGRAGRRRYPQSPKLGGRLQSA